MGERGELLVRGPGFRQARLIAFLSHWEGRRSRPYQDVVGLWTVGVGHLLGRETPTKWHYTEDEIDALLALDLERYERGVIRLCGRLDQSQHHALCSFAFNVGLGSLQRSTLRQRVLRRADNAGDAFLSWNKAGGRVIRGLTLRRQAERALYCGSQPEYDSGGRDSGGSAGDGEPTLRD